MVRKSFSAFLVPVIALMLGASSVALSANLVTNGGFETTTAFAEFDRDATVAGWTSNGYNFVFAPGTADTTGSHTSQFGGQQLTLWGPNNGSSNGLPSSSPDGGNFVAADGAFQTAPIEQTINGLTPGESYTLSFYWAGAQQFGFDGATTEQWQVSLGGDTQSTAVVNNASHGFTGWMHESFTFTATSTSELLSFLAVGTPSGVPPFSLLDGVSLELNSSVPEPGTLSLFAMGLIGIAAIRARRRATAA